MVGAQFPILSGSFVQVVLPEDLVLGDETATINDSYTEGIADLSTTITLSPNKQIVTFANSFLQDSAPNGFDWRQDSFAVYIAGITSPRTTAPTLSFKCYILAPDGFTEY